MELRRFRPSPDEGPAPWPTGGPPGAAGPGGDEGASYGWPEAPADNQGHGRARTDWSGPRPADAGPGGPPPPGNGLARTGYGDWAPPEGPPHALYPAPRTGSGPGPGPQSGPGSGRGDGKPQGVLRRTWERIAASAVAVVAFVAKFGALLLKIKYLGLVLSMVLSVLAYTLLWGWTFAVGFVLLMFVHEMGHVIVLKRQGIRASLPMFIPFLGAFVNMKDSPRSAYEEALSGLAGPYFGVAASVVVGFWAHATGSNFLLQLAAVGFLLNLFNLMPALPLDGGRAVGALHPAIWFLGLVGLLVFFVYTHAPIVLIILLLGGFELYRRWTRRNSPSSVAYNTLKPQQRLTIGSLYLFIVAAALVGFQLTYVSRSL